MGEVAIVYKVMPEGTDIDLNVLKEAITETVSASCKINSIEEKPVAFGLKALEVQLIFDDREGGDEDLEERLQGIEGVASVETIQVGLL